MGRADRAFAAGVVIVTALGLLDAYLELSFLGALVIGAFVAALAASPRQVAAVGGYALGWVVVLGYEGERWTAEHWLRLAVVAAGSVAAVAVAVGRHRQVAALIRATDVAEAAQRALLRPLAERYDGIELAVRYVSAADGALVGGDVYDVQVTPWGLRILVGDVSGHGLDAVERASNLVFAFREAAFRCETLSELASTIDHSLRRLTASAGGFATGLLLQIEDQDVEIANCGHPDPLLIDDRHLSWLRPPARSRPFGLRPTPSTTRRIFVSGERLVAYTDGLIDARNERGEFFDLEHHAAMAFGSESLETALDDLLERLRTHSTRARRDDVVVLAIRQT